MGGTFAEWEGWDWISDFGDPIAEHHAVREAVGLWDESPLRKWLFQGHDALAAADYCFTSDMAGLAVGQVRYGAFCDERGKMLGDGAVYNAARTTRASSSSPRSRPTATTSAALRREGHGRRDRGAHVRAAAPAAAGPALARADGARCRRRTSRRCATSAFLADVTIGGVPGCLVSRTGYSGEHGYEMYTPPENAERLWTALLDAGPVLGIRPYGLAAVESLRIESGLIFIGYDYFPGYTSPFHMNLERMIKLDKPDFVGKDALVAEHEARHHAPDGHARDRRRGGARLQHAGLPPRARGRAACSRRATAARRPSTG